MSSRENLPSSEDGSLSYYCYICKASIIPIRPDIICPSCRGGFVVLSSDLEQPADNEISESARSNETNSAQVLDSMVETSLRNAMSIGNVHPGVISFSINAPRDGSNGSSNSNQGTNNDMSNEIGMINDIISRVFGSTDETFLVPNGASIRTGVIPGGQLHGNPQDYAWGQNAFDNIISQLLGQLDNVGPPPASSETIQGLPTVKITKKNVDDLTECSVCMESFKLDEEAKKMPCNHLFHLECITPWLQRHNTCPICRKQVGNSASSNRRPHGSITFGSGTSGSGTSIQLEPQVNLRRLDLTPSGSDSFVISPLSSLFAENSDIQPLRRRGASSYFLNNLRNRWSQGRSSNENDQQPPANQNHQEDETD